MLEMSLISGNWKPIELIPHSSFRYSNDYVKRLFVLQWRWSEVGNFFEFTNRNENKETGTRVWRSAEPFDQFNLPAEPHLVLPPGATSFTDPDAPRGSVYYYMLEVYRGVGNSEFTGPLKATAGAINTGPGPQNMIAGDHLAGFYGEVPVSELITGDALASAIGLTAGIAQHSNEHWLKFNLDGKTLFVSKKPIRHTVTWNHLNAVNVVYGNRTVVINGDTYKVRLLKGANSDPAMTVSHTYDHPGTHGSEWNRLLYRISGYPFAHPSNTLASEGITEGDWAQYSEAELVTHSNWGSGSYCWCQEAQGSTRVGRGHIGVSYLELGTASFAGSTGGWRACLELVD